MQYTTHRRSMKDFWKSRNTKFYLAVFFIFIAIITVIVLTVRPKSGSISNNDNTEIIDNSTPVPDNTETTEVIKAGAYEISINLDNCMISVINTEMERVIRMMPAGIPNGIKEGTYEPVDAKECRFTWKNTEDSNYYRYYTDFGNGFTFHSSRYKEQHNKNSLIADDYNCIGSVTDSSGVILTIEDAKWIYENCSSDSYITVVNKDSQVKPDTFKIPNNMTWDPTEISNESPWCQSTIKVLECPEIVEIEVGESVNALKRSIKATDDKGADITAYTMFFGHYNTDTPGNYKIMVQIADIYGNVLTDTISLIVVMPETESETDETDETEEQDTTDDETEDSTEESSEFESEEVTEPETEPATELETETVTESETEIATETESEIQSETESEAESASDEHIETIDETQPESESPADIVINHLFHVILPYF